MNNKMTSLRGILPFLVTGLYGGGFGMPLATC